MRFAVLTAFAQPLHRPFTAFPPKKRPNFSKTDCFFSQLFPHFSAAFHKAVENKKTFHFFRFFPPFFPDGKAAGRQDGERVYRLFHCFHRLYYYY